ncbi:MAG: translation initiation factor IF-2 [Bacteroidia bacterium]|nr:translation initiation factor IF-2 [Bacteroidia bacterium]MDW8088628.1 translation initiation factor IF-2 [Bacteroidia bacterium]
MSDRMWKLGELANELQLSTTTLAKILDELGLKIKDAPMERIPEEYYQRLMQHLGRGKKESASERTRDLPESLGGMEEGRSSTAPLGKIRLGPRKRIVPSPVFTPLSEMTPSPPPPPPVEETPTTPPSPSTETPSVELPFIVGKIELPSSPPPRKKPITLTPSPLFHSPLASQPSSPSPSEEAEARAEAPVLESPSEGEKSATGRRRKRVRKKRKELRATLQPIAKTKASSPHPRRPVKSQLKASGDVATRRRFRQEKYRQREKKRELERLEAEAAASTIEIAEYVTAAELAKALNVPVNQVIAKCLELGYPTSINQRLERDLAAIIAEEFGYKVKFISLDDTLEQLTAVPESPADLQPRPPIVTVMGHVDHGKTTLLDYIRNTNVVAGEAGGITQHIGAYEVTLPSGQKITFLDTPGHEAFTAMRARGAQVTDIAIIVVAADDQVRPQTLEALNHAQAAGVPIIFAINKIDKDTANPDRIRQQLAEAGFLVEEWGGPYPAQLISAKKGTGVQELLEKTLILAELLDLKANPHRPAKGTVIEAQLDKARGPTATVLVQTGTLRVGDIILVGQFFGRVRALLDERGRRLEQAGPSQPVQVLGLSGVPEVGDKLYVLEEESVAREMAHRRAELMREKERRKVSGSLLEGVASGQTKQLNLIVKADVSGSVEALTDSLVKLSTPEVQVNVIHRGVGQITDSDVLLAKASNALIVGFQVRPSPTARQLARQNNVEVRLYNVIYDIIDEVKSALSGMLTPIIQQETIGSAEVRQIFKIPKVGTVAGCKVIEGKIVRGAKAHLIREGVVIYTSSIASLKRSKDDVKEVAEGLECGLSIEGFQDIKVGDIIECFTEVQVKRTL